MPALERATEALLGPLFDVAPSEPYAATIFRARRSRGASVDVSRLFAHWDGVHPGSAIGALRYRWVLTHQYVDVPSWAGPPTAWTPGRPAEKEVMGDPFAFESRLSIPAIVTDCAELLAELLASPDAEMAATAPAAPRG